MELGMPDALITDRAVFFDGRELPWHIAQDGISFKPGGSDDLNTLTIEFFVESATFELSWETKHGKRWTRLHYLVELTTANQHSNIDRLMREFS